MAPMRVQCQPQASAAPWAPCPGWDGCDARWRNGHLLQHPTWQQRPQPPGWAQASELPVFHWPGNTDGPTIAIIGGAVTMVG